MKIFRPNTNAYTLVTKEGKKIKLMKNNEFERFNPNILDLGDIKKPSIATNAICAIFDLQGFTNFCKQIDPQLSVPSFMGGFLDWIFGALRSETVEKKFEEGVKLWHALPFCTKFLGDGLLVLWDTSEMDQESQHNLIVSLYLICNRYNSEFLPGMKKKVGDPPDSLRCGITKGTVYSVGDGNDFVGPCINLAARIQKLPGTRIVFALRGFDPESEMAKNAFDMWILKKIAIRGMGNEELIYLRKKDFNAMSEQDKALYHDP
ncbi:MAG: hypothetical protein ACHQ2F_08500 [Desulfobaccales bacterium]